MWDKVKHQQNAEPGQLLKIEFIYFGNKKIFKIESSCNCVSTNFKNNILTAKWKVSNTKEEYQSYKYIFITYEDKTVEELTLIANINGKD